MSDVQRRELLKGGAALAGLAAVAAVVPLTSAKAAGTAGSVNTGKDIPLKRYVIEREVAGIGKSDAKQLCNISQTSDDALAKLAPRIQWEHSYVADNKTFCIYLAENEDAIMEHSKLSGFPANKITLVDVIIDPTTANPPRA